MPRQLGKAAGRAEAGNLGWNVAAVHDIDDGFSASRFAKKQRKGWLALQEDIGAGRVHAVIMRTPRPLYPYHKADIKGQMH
jgi:hypothetical protein